MKVIKKVFALITLIVLVLSLYSIVIADGPLPAPYLTINIDGLTENVKFIDLFVKLPTSDIHYTMGNNIIIKEGLSYDCGLVKYRVHGYVSFSAHFDNADHLGITDSWPQDTVNFWKNFSYDEYENMKTKFNTIKIALIDKKGEIIIISPEININPVRTYFTSIINYNMISNTVFTVTETALLPIIFWFMCLVIIPWIITISMETLIGFFFAIKPLIVVLFTNMGSNLILNAMLFAVIYISNVRMIPSLVLITGELLVIAGEYMIYTIFIRNTKKIKLLIFSIVANATSFLIGVLFNYFGGNLWGI